MALRRDVCIIPGGRWRGSLHLQCCQSTSFEVCQLHKKSPTKRQRKKDPVWGFGEGKSWCLYSALKHDVFFFPSEFCSRSFIYGPNEKQAQSRKEMDFRKSRCATTKMVLQFAFGDFQMAVSTSRAWRLNHFTELGHRRRSLHSNYLFYSFWMTWNKENHPVILISVRQTLPFHCLLSL